MTDTEFLKQCAKKDTLTSEDTDGMMELADKLEWISIKDKLPEKDIRVIAFSERMKDSPDCDIQIARGWQLRKANTCTFRIGCHFHNHQKGGLTNENLNQ